MDAITRVEAKIQDGYLKRFILLNIYRNQLEHLNPHSAQRHGEEHRVGL